MKALLVCPLIAALCLCSACDKSASEKNASTSASASAIGISECAACKMVVREQPAPRGQVVHRDGTREHFCSIGDLVQYLQTPSPHGKAQAIYVEALEAGFDPKASDTKARPWTDAQSAHYVLGVKRQRIMGPAVLSYSDRTLAEKAAVDHGGQLATWQQLQNSVLERK